MKDRLDELRGYQDGNGAFLDTEAPSTGYFNMAFREEPHPGLEEFFREVSGLSAELDKLRELSEEIRSKQESVLCCTTVEEVCAEKQRLAQLKGLFSQQARTIQESLAGMKALMETAGWQGRGAEGRIRQCQFNALLRLHERAVGRHYAWEMEYAGRLREQIARQTQLAGLQLGEEEIEKLADSPQAPRLVGSDIQALEARRRLALAQERHQQLLALEAQVTELHGLFLSLGVLVSEQQAMLDSIEYNVLQTEEYVAESSREVKKALQYKRRSRLSGAVAALLGLCVGCGCICCATRGLPLPK